MNAVTRCRVQLRSASQFALVIITKFIQASLCKMQGLLKTILVFKDLKYMKNPDLHVIILFLKC